MVPRTDSLARGDVFLANDGKNGTGTAPIVLRWATCAAGVYPHMISIQLFKTAAGGVAFPVYLAEYIEDTGACAVRYSFRTLSVEPFLTCLSSQLFV